MDKAKLKFLITSFDTTIKQAMQSLNNVGGKILFVTDSHEKLLGTVTDGDIRRGIINGLDFNDTLERIMNKDFIAIKCDAPNMPEQAKNMMIERKITEIPVLDGNGVICDVILWSDMLENKKNIKHTIKLENQVVIMAGGKGTRLDPFTKILPKPLIPIDNKPVIELIMEKFYQYGFYKFLYTLNYKKEYIKLFLKENNFPYNIDWAEEDDFLGTAGGLALLKDKLTDTFFLTNCDSLIETDFEKVLAWHKEHDAAITIIGCHNEVKIPFGVLELSAGKLEKISEKPVHDIIINTGAYVMEPRVISYLPENKRMDMNQVIDIVSRNEKVSVYPIYGGWFDIGQWEEYKNTLMKFGGIAV